jgi:NitT/TauT family transport system ATP-binding protein
MSLIVFDDVAKSYRSRSGAMAPAVRNFSLELGRNEFFCLLGPSGCGKTSLLAMLAGFEAPSSGRILLEDVPVTGPSRDRGVVFQGDDSLFPWLTALENIEFGLRVGGQHRAERRQAALRYLEMVGLKGQQDKYPPELSGGMKQRIQIARALANTPKLLLMDEPFGALDAQTRGIMQRQLRRIWQNTNAGVFFITHDIDEAIILGTRVGVMTAGPGGTLKEIIPIDLPGERTRADPAYGAYYARIEAAIRQEVQRATSGQDWAA